MSHRPAAHPPASAAHRSFSLAVAGSGGAGVMTAGTLLLDAAARAGLYGLMVRTSGPQIRGGEAAALLRLSAAPVATPSNRVNTARISGAESSAATKCISDVPGLPKQTSTPDPTSVRNKLSAPFMLVSRP